MKNIFKILFLLFSVTAFSQTGPTQTFNGRVIFKYQPITTTNTKTLTLNPTTSEIEFKDVPDVKNWIKSNENLVGATRKGDVLYGILDQYTGQEITLSKTLDLNTIDNIVYFQLGSEKFKRNVLDNTIDIESFGVSTDKDNSLILNQAIKSCLSTRFNLKVNGIYDINSSSKIKVDSNGYLNIIGNDITKSGLRFNSDTGGLEYRMSDDSHMYECKISNIALIGNGNNDLLKTYKSEQFLFDNVAFSNAGRCLVLENASIFHSSRMTLLDSESGVVFEGESGMCTFDKFNFYNIQKAIDVRGLITKLNILDGWAEDNTVFIDINNSAGVDLGNVSIDNCNIRSSLINAKMLNIENSMDFLSLENFSVTNTRISFNTSNTSVFDFSNTVTGVGRICNLYFENSSFYIPNLILPNSLVKTSASQSLVGFNFACNTIDGIDNTQLLFMGGGRFSGVRSKYGYNNAVGNLNVENGSLSTNTLTPRGALDVRNDGDTVAFVESNTAGYTSIFLQSSLNAGLIGTLNSKPFRFYTNALDRGGFTSGGTFEVIGKATVGSAPTDPTDVPRKQELDLKDNINTYAAKTANYTLIPADYTIDFTSGTNTATLPSAATNLNKKYIIKNSGTGKTTIQPVSGQTIDGVSQMVLFNQNSVAEFQSDGANWKLIGTYATTSVLNSALTTTQTAATLNAAYPDAWPPFVVYAPNVGSGMVYIKTTTGGQWIMYSGSILNP